MKRKTLFILLTILLVLVLCWYFLFRKKELVTTYSSQTPSIGHIAETVTATGTIQPVDTVAVGTQVSGTVQKIYVDYNSVVKKGQLLAVLDKTLFQASLDQAKGNLANQQSNLVYQKGNFERQSELYKVGAISKADYDNALFSLQSAKATVEAQSANVASAQKNFSLASIYSPIDGTILSRNVSEGQTVAASFSTPTLFTIAKDLKKMQVRASVDEADVGNIKVGERSTFTVDAFLNDIFNGSIEEIRLSPITSSNVVTYTTIIDAPNQDLKLKPGMTANIIIYTKEADSALIVPEKALKFNPTISNVPKDYTIIKDKDSTGKSAPNEGYVWIMKSKNLIQKKVITGLDDNTKVQILSGLSDKDTVITAESQISSNEASTQDAASPFMPKRPSRGKRK